MTETIESEPERKLHRIDEEDVRLITGFADCFAAIALAGVIIALNAFVGALLGPVAGIAGGAAVWFLTKPLVETRQFAACALVLSIAFAVSLAMLCFPWLNSFGAIPVAIGLWIYWKRFRIPLSAALSIAFAVFFPVALLFGTDGMSPSLLGYGGAGTIASLIVGLILFAVAMYWDISDRDRTTRRSDVAFWLHLLAGPLAVHGLFSLLGFNQYSMGTGSAWPVVGLFAFFTIVALVIDRRPLLLSSFGYFLYALGRLVYEQMNLGTPNTGEGIPQAIMVAALAAGLLVVLLAAGWSPMRRFILARLPSKITAYVPLAGDWALPTESASSDEAKGESEPLRLILGLNDYLAALGIGVLFLGSLAASYVIMMSSAIGRGFGGSKRAAVDAIQGATPWLAWLVPVTVVALCAEFFVRRRRMALTAVTTSTYIAILSAMGAALIVAQQDDGVFGQNTIAAIPLMLACIAAAMLNWGFGWFNKVPASAAWGTAMLLPLFFIDALSGNHPDRAAMADEVAVRFLIFGLIVFAVAIWLDRSDPERKSQRADIGFWMHLLASLVIVPTLYNWVSKPPAPAFPGMALFVVLGIVALAINRRALLLIGIPYVIGYAAFLGGNSALFANLIFFGLLMLLVIYWDKVRQMMLQAIGKPPLASA